MTAAEESHLIAAVTWWRDYAINLRTREQELKPKVRAAYPTSPYPPLTQYVPMPPPGVIAGGSRS